MLSAKPALERCVEVSRECGQLGADAIPFSRAERWFGRVLGADVEELSAGVAAHSRSHRRCQSPGASHRQRGAPSRITGSKVGASMPNHGSWCPPLGRLVRQEISKPPTSASRCSPTRKAA